MRLHYLLFLSLFHSLRHHHFALPSFLFLSSSILILSKWGNSILVYVQIQLNFLSLMHFNNCFPYFFSTPFHFLQHLILYSRSFFFFSTSRYWLMPVPALHRLTSFSLVYPHPISFPFRSVVVS